MQGWVEVNDGAKGLAEIGFKTLALNSNKESLQKCPNFVARVKCLEDKMDVESEPHFLSLGLGFKLSNFHPELTTRI